MMKMTIMKAKKIVSIVDGCSLLWPCWLRWLFLVASSLHSILWSRILTVVKCAFVFVQYFSSQSMWNWVSESIIYFSCVDQDGYHMYHSMVTSLSSMWSNLSAAAKAPSPIIVLFPAKQKCFHFLFSQQPKNFHFYSILWIFRGRLGLFGCFTITKFSPVNAPAPASASSGAWKEIKLSWQGWCDIPAETKMMWCSCCVCDKDGD